MFVTFFIKKINAMKVSFFVIIIELLISNWGIGQGIDRKTIYDCKVTFDVSVIDTQANTKVRNEVSKTVKVSYVKGNKSRNDFISPGFLQTTIFSSQTDTVVVLKEVGNAKYLSYLDTMSLKGQNDKYDAIRFSTTTDSKNILGYECKKAQAQYPDGTYAFVYYAPAIEPSNKDFQKQFKELPGFVLEYEAFLEDGKTRVRYIATAMDLSPVPSSMFEWPKKGYKLL